MQMWKVLYLSKQFHWIYRALCMTTRHRITPLSYIWNLKRLKRVMCFKKWNRNQPLNVKVHWVRLMRFTGLCSRSSSDSSWLGTTKAYISRVKLLRNQFWFWLEIIHCKYKHKSFFNREKHWRVIDLYSCTQWGQMTDWAIFLFTISIMIQQSLSTKQNKNIFKKALLTSGKNWVGVLFTQSHDLPSHDAVCPAGDQRKRNGHWCNDWPLEQGWSMQSLTPRVFRLLQVRKIITKTPKKQMVRW